jgi:hypothetical protein
MPSLLHVTLDPQRRETAAARPAGRQLDALVYRALAGAILAGYTVQFTTATTLVDASPNAHSERRLERGNAEAVEAELLVVARRQRRRPVL